MMLAKLDSGIGTSGFVIESFVAMSSKGMIEHSLLSQASFGLASINASIPDVVMPVAFRRRSNLNEVMIDGR